MSTVNTRSLMCGLGLGLLGAALSACSGVSPQGTPDHEGQTPTYEAEAPLIALSPESAKLGIDHWGSNSTSDGNQLIAVDREGVPLAEAVVEPMGLESSAAELWFSYPEEGSVRLFQDGRLETNSSGLLEAFARAAFADLGQSNQAAARHSRSPLGTLEQALTFANGSLHYNSNLFGHHEVRVVGASTCPNGETRSHAIVSGRKKAKRCSFLKWHVTDTSDCRIQIDVDIPSLKSEDCDYEVVSL